jgi:hypothetical protein
VGARSISEARGDVQRLPCVQCATTIHAAPHAYLLVDALVNAAKGAAPQHQALVVLVHRTRVQVAASVTGWRSLAMTPAAGAWLRLLLLLVVVVVMAGGQQACCVSRHVLRRHRSGGETQAATSGCARACADTNRMWVLKGWQEGAH